MNKVEVEYYDFEEAEAALLKALELLREKQSDTIELEGQKLRVATDAQLKKLSVTQVIGTVEKGSTVIGAKLTNLG